MLEYYKLRLSQGAASESPLLIDGDGKVLCRNKFLGYLRHILDSLGLNDARYCGHSFRIGAATSAAAAGVEDHLIQTLGRWSSNCYIRYIRTDMKSVRKAQVSLCLM